MVESMTIDEFKELTNNGQLFTIEFIKRGTGDLRIMNARRGVSKGVKGVGMSYNPDDYNLLTVYDMKVIDANAAHNVGKSEEELQRGAFRSINLEALVSLRMNGKKWSWNNAARRFEVI